MNDIDTSYLLQEHSNSVKNKAHKLIEKGDLTEMREYFEENQIKPNEELSEITYNWNCMHYASHFKRPLILHYLLQLANKYYPYEIVQILNQRTKEGWDPLMICCIYKSPECLRVLIELGGSNLTNVDL